jgi:hypothetical protein
MIEKYIRNKKWRRLCASKSLLPLFYSAPLRISCF